jgi:hypothetical protein
MTEISVTDIFGGNRGPITVLVPGRQSHHYFLIDLYCTIARGETELQEMDTQNLFGASPLLGLPRVVILAR